MAGPDAGTSMAGTSLEGMAMRLALALIVLGMTSGGLSGAAMAENGPCVAEATVGTDRTIYYDCLSRGLMRAVPPLESRLTAGDVAPLGTSSTSLKLGTFNQGAVRQRLGNSFGKSVVPQRPN